MSNNFDLRKFLSENKLTTTSKAITEKWDDKSVKAYADAMSVAYGNKPKDKEGGKPKDDAYIKKPVSEMNGGYVEAMGPDFDDAIDLLAHAWNQWKNGPSTEEEDIEPAKADILSYVKSVLI